MFPTKVVTLRFYKTPALFCVVVRLTIIKWQGDLFQLIWPMVYTTLLVEVQNRKAVFVLIAFRKEFSENCRIQSAYIIGLTTTRQKKRREKTQTRFLLKTLMDMSYRREKGKRGAPISFLLDLRFACGIAQSKTQLWFSSWTITTVAQR